MKDKIWENSEYENAEELSARIGWEGGLASFVLNYGGSGLPTPLFEAGLEFMEALRKLVKTFNNYGVYEEEFEA